jgi:hypothetical protein
MKAKALKRRLENIHHAVSQYNPLPVLVEDLTEFNGDQDAARRRYHPAEVHFSWESYVSIFV